MADTLISVKLITVMYVSLSTASSASHFATHLEPSSFFSFVAMDTCNSEVLLLLSLAQLYMMILLNINYSMNEGVK